jgi:hypothetical protein
MPLQRQLTTLKGPMAIEESSQNTSCDGKEESYVRQYRILHMISL